MISLGLDSGSSMTKAVLLEDMKIIDTKMIPTSISPRKSLEALYREIKKQHKEIDVIVTTGYGRNQADFKITEITCHAAGAFFMNPDCDTIIDIGGQDSKVITIDDLGCVTDFLMNDKCAAGTGRFLEMMMKRVESEIGRIDTFVKDSKPAKINSMCAVFAESEIVGLLAQDIAPGDIVLGCVESICQRTASFAQKLAPANPKVFFSGGLAQFDVIKRSLASHLGVKEVATDPLCQYTGAIGAAVLGIRKIK